MSLQDQLEPLASQLADIRAEKARLAERETWVRARIYELCPGPDRYQAGEFLLTVTQQRRIDTAAVEAKYPWERHPELYAWQVDSAEVHQYLSLADTEPLVRYVYTVRVT